jgi:hypothetical protein
MRSRDSRVNATDNDCMKKASSIGGSGNSKKKMSRRYHRDSLRDVT